MTVNLKASKGTLRHWLIGLIVSAQLSLSQGVIAAEFRGLWVDAFGPGFLDKVEVQKLVKDCRKYNFNAVFVEMRRRGDAFYDPKPPNPDPKTTVISENFDALAEIINACHEGSPRIEVHCWLVTHFVWAWKRPPPQSNHVFNLHPEYLTQDSIGQKNIGGSFFLDPGNPSANQWIHDVAMDVASRYDIDGIHWDYCRYPAQDSGYNQEALNRFKEESKTHENPKPSDGQFILWRQRQVNDFLRWVNADLLELKPRLVISAAVFSDVRDSRDYRFANWPEWTREGLVDVVIPMNFSDDNQRVYWPRAKSAKDNQYQRVAYMGQGGYKNTPQDTLDQLRYARDQGFQGTVFYSYRQPARDTTNQQEVLEFIKKEFQPTFENTPSLPWKSNCGIIKGIVCEGPKNVPVYNALVTLNDSARHHCLTETHGNYCFFSIPPGNYELAIERLQVPRRIEKVQVIKGRVTTLNLRN
jgi:uncharacterized lipoprotein YddW (UPF0748 family)